MTPLVVVVALAAGAVGALARFGVTSLFAHPRVRLPWGVFVVNALGSLLGGVLLGLADAGAVDPGTRAILFAGFAGGFTTFSTFTVETVQLARDGRLRLAAANVAGNAVVGVGLAALGYLAAAALAA